MSSLWSLCLYSHREVFSWYHPFCFSRLIYTCLNREVITLKRKYEWFPSPVLWTFGPVYSGESSSELVAQILWAQFIFLLQICSHQRPHVWRLQKHEVCDHLYHLPSDELLGCKDHTSASFHLQGLRAVSGSRLALKSKIDEWGKPELVLIFFLKWAIFSPLSSILPANIFFS